MNKKVILHVIKNFDRLFLGGKLKKFYSKVQNSPNGVCVDISGTCNLTCKMCSLKKWYPKDINRLISDDVLEKIYEIAPKVRSIALMNNCEPLINRNIVGIIKKLKNINPMLQVGFVTNGMLLSDELSSKLIDAGTDLIYFSIDGATPEVNDKTRIGSKLEKVIKNIDVLNEAKKNKGVQNPKLGFVTVASTENVHELCDIVRLASKMKIETININGLEPYDSEMDNKKLWGDTVNPEYEQVFNKLKKLSKEYGIEINLPSLTIHDFNFCTLIDSVVDANGDVYPCSSLSYQRQYYFLGKEMMFPRISFGNLSEKSFDEVWNSKQYSEFRKKVSRGEFPEYCKNCIFQRKVTCAI